MPGRHRQYILIYVYIYIFLLFSLLLPIKQQTAHLAKHSELRVREKRHHTHTVWGGMGNWVHFIKGGLLLFTSPSCLRYGIKSIARALNGFRVESNTKWNETCNVLFNHLPMLIPWAGRGGFLLQLRRLLHVSHCHHWSQQTCMLRIYVLM